MPYPIRVDARALILRDGAVLLIEYDDETGLHYNLPGGGVDEGESIRDAVRREALEEASVEVEPGPLAFAVEYEPARNRQWAGRIHKLSLIFACTLVGDAQPRMSATPDTHQIGVKWIPLAELESVELLPHIADRIVQYAAQINASALFLEEPIRPEKVARYIRQR